MTSCNNYASGTPTIDILNHFEFIPTSIGLYKLKVKSTGDANGEDYSTTEILSFNGERYSPKEDELFGCKGIWE